jgi:glyoxalase family protein
MQLNGFHHLTAVTADAPQNLRFYTQTLGLRLVKKTVNQDDTSAYHLFYADGRGTPGTDVTFFDWPMTRERRGTHSITRTGLRVASLDTLRYWETRLKELNVQHTPIADRDGRATLDLEDFEGQRLSLVADEDGLRDGQPWSKSPVPAEHQVRGLGPITISVPVLKPTDAVLTQVMNMRHAREYDHAGTPVHVYEMADGTAHAQLHVAVERNLPPARNGAGGVHHVAFRVPTFEEYDQWYERLNELGVRSSGPVDRFYFRSLYFREPNGILFELATDQPGFAADEPMETLGEHLALPPFLEPRREMIEANLQPL